MYCSHTYDAPPTIDNCAGHPFMAQYGGGAVPAALAAAGGAAPAEGPSSTVAAALGSRGGSAPAAVPDTAVPAVKPAEPAAAPTTSFDLLSMDDDSPVRLPRRSLLLRASGCDLGTGQLLAADSLISGSLMVSKNRELCLDMLRGGLWQPDRQQDREACLGRLWGGQDHQHMDATQQCCACQACPAPQVGCGAERSFGTSHGHSTTGLRRRLGCL